MGRKGDLIMNIKCIGLEILANNIKNYNPKECDGESKQDLQDEFERLKNIPYTLNVLELRLIWYLRNLGRPELMYLLVRNARKSCIAWQETLATRDKLAELILNSSSNVM